MEVKVGRKCDVKGAGNEGQEVVSDAPDDAGVRAAGMESVLLRPAEPRSTNQSSA